MLRVAAITAGMATPGTVRAGIGAVTPSGEAMAGVVALVGTAGSGAAAAAAGTETAAAGTETAAAGTAAAAGMMTTTTIRSR